MHVGAVSASVWGKAFAEACLEITTSTAVAITGTRSQGAIHSGETRSAITTPFNTGSMLAAFVGASLLAAIFLGKSRVALANSCRLFANAISTAIAGTPLDGAVISHKTLIAGTHSVPSAESISRAVILAQSLGAIIGSVGHGMHSFLTIVAIETPATHARTVFASNLVFKTESMSSAIGLRTRFGDGAEFSFESFVAFADTISKLAGCANPVLGAVVLADARTVGAKVPAVANTLTMVANSIPSAVAWAFNGAIRTKESWVAQTHTINAFSIEVASLLAFFDTAIVTVPVCSALANPSDLASSVIAAIGRALGELTGLALPGFKATALS